MDNGKHWALRDPKFDTRMRTLKHICRQEGRGVVDAWMVIETAPDHEWVMDLAWTITVPVLDNTNIGIAIPVPVFRQYNITHTSIGTSRGYQLKYQYKYKLKHNQIMKDNWTCSVGCTNTSTSTNIRTTWNRNSIIIYNNNTDWKTRRLWIVLDNTILVVMKSTFQQVCFATKQRLRTTLGILHAYAMQHGEGADGVHWIECIFVQKGGTLASACLDMASRPPKWNYTGSGRKVMQVNYQMCSLYLLWLLISPADGTKAKAKMRPSNTIILHLKNQTKHTYLWNTPYSFEKHTLQFWIREKSIWKHTFHETCSFCGSSSPADGRRGTGCSWHAPATEASWTILC